MTFLQQIIANVMGFAGVIIAGYFTMKKTSAALDLTILKLKNEIISLITPLQKDVENLKEMHVDENLKRELKKIKETWISIAKSENSNRLAIFMVDNVTKVFNEVATKDYTYRSYQKTKTLIQAIKENSSIVARNEFNFSDKVFDAFDEIVEHHIKRALLSFNNLAYDNIHNDKYQRIQQILLDYARDYSSDVIKLLTRENL